jgi:glycosyltransferase involved in cell wall biosynthesis
MKPKRIIVFTIGNIDHASSRIRGIQYMPLFQKDGFEVKWIPRIGKKPISRIDIFLNPFIKRWYIIKQLFYLLFAKADVFFIQKVFFDKYFLQHVKKRKIKIIFDFDDAIYLNQKNLFDIDKKNEARTKIILFYSDLVITSTPILTEWASHHHKNVITITTPVDILHSKNKTEVNNEFIIGWIGSGTNTVHLDELKAPLITLAKKHKIKFLVVGANKGFNIQGVDLILKNWEFEKEDEYLSLMDIGVMPLLDNNYSKGKGGYKILVYMGVGIPVVATPIGFNNEIIESGKTGFFAKTINEWVIAIEFLINNPAKRLEMGMNAFKIIETKYSRKVCYEILLKSINDLDVKTYHNPTLK